MQGKASAVAADKINAKPLFQHAAAVIPAQGQGGDSDWKKKNL
jgi:hypothetical protein